MKKVFLIARHEYQQMVHKRSFLLTTLGLPLLIVLVSWLSASSYDTGDTFHALGYLDPDSVLGDSSISSVWYGDVEHSMMRYDERATAEAALEAGDVEVVFVVGATYLQDGALQTMYWSESPDDGTFSIWNRFVRLALTDAYPDDIARRLANAMDVTAESLEGETRFGSEGIPPFVVAMAAAMIFVLASIMSSSYLLQAVVGEKENRTIEVMASTVTPEQLVGGKTLGLLAVALTQIAVWVASGLFALSMFAPEDFAALSFETGNLLLLALYFVPSFALLGGVMVAIGAASTESRQAQQFSGPLTLPFVLPMMMIVLFFTAPESPVVTAMTLFPTTSFMSVAVLMSLGDVALWQILAGQAILWASALIMVWVAARVFRMGMLRTGQRLSWKQIKAGLRGGDQA